MASAPNRRVDHGRPDVGNAIGKRQREFAGGHVVEGEPLHQRDRAVLLGEAQLSDRQVVPRRAMARSRAGKRPRTLAMLRAQDPRLRRREPSRKATTRPSRVGKQHQERRPGQAQSAEQQPGEQRSDCVRAVLRAETTASIVRLIQGERQALRHDVGEQLGLGRRAARQPARRPDRTRARCRRSARRSARSPARRA